MNGIANRHAGTIARIARTATFVLSLVWFGLFLAPAAGAQETGTLGVTVQNQLEYSRSTEDSLEILLNWMDVDATYGNFSAGFRYQAFQPPQHNDPLGEAVRQGIPYRYFEGTRDWGTLRAGNTYAIFGRGLTLNLYEDRSIHVDNNLDGLEYRGQSHGVGLTALTGRAPVLSTDRWETAPQETRQDLLHAADVTVHPVPAILVGGTLVTQRYPGLKVGDVQPDVVRQMTGARTQIWAGPLAVYAENARLTNPSSLQNPSGQRGEGTYVSATLSGPGVGFFADVKNYNRFAFKSSNGQVDLNSPPAGTRENAYTLLNRHPHQLNADGERGYQLETTLTPRAGTVATLNYSHTRDDFLPNLYNEGYAELHHEAALAGLENMTGLISSVVDSKTKTRNLALIGEGTTQVGDVWKMRLEYGNAHTKDILGGAVGEYDDHLAIVELTRPKISTGVTFEWTNMSMVQRSLLRTDVSKPLDNKWFQLNLGLQTIEDTDLTISVGSRRGGYECVGGRCRQVDPFQGVEIKALTHF